MSQPQTHCCGECAKQYHDQFITRTKIHVCVRVIGSCCVLFGAEEVRLLRVFRVGGSPQTPSCGGGAVCVCSGGVVFSWAGGWVFSVALPSWLLVGRGSFPFAVVGRSIAPPPLLTAGKAPKIEGDFLRIRLNISTYQVSVLPVRSRALLSRMKRSPLALRSAQSPLWGQKNRFWQETRGLGIFRALLRASASCHGCRSQVHLLNSLTSLILSSLLVYY